MKSIYMSGYTADAIDHQGMLDEGIAFLAKPIGLDTLVRKLREVLDGPGAAGGSCPLRPVVYPDRSTGARDRACSQGKAARTSSARVRMKSPTTSSGVQSA